MMKASRFALLLLVGLVALGLAAGACDDDGDDGHDDGASDDDNDDDDNDTAVGDDDDDDTPFECAVDNQDAIVGLLYCRTGAHEGYSLFSPLFGFKTYLIDMYGRVVNQWRTNHTPGNSEYLLTDGTLLRTGAVVQPYFVAGGAGGVVQRLDWDGNLLWEFEYASPEHVLHHDIEMLPNGNILMIAFEHKSAAEAIAAGRDPDLLADDELWIDHLIEVRPSGARSGDIVWEWHIWDHLVQDFDPTKAHYGVVADHPERIDVNYINEAPIADWTHLNTVTYHVELDQIMLSSREFSEVWIIDHGTTTEEAAGHTGGRYGRGGDLLYRWGNPAAYRIPDAEQTFYGQHDTHWIADGLSGAGHALAFNNGDLRAPVEFSSIDEWILPLQADGSYEYFPGVGYGPDAPVWSYAAPNPGDFFAPRLSGVQRLPGGNTLICDGTNGEFFEVTPAGQIVWRYVNPITPLGAVNPDGWIPETPDGRANAVFRVRRFDPDYPGLAGRDLTPGDTIEGGR